MKNKYGHTLLTASFILLTVIPSFGADRWFADIEGGPAWNGYNDVRIPGTTGTEFSLTKDLDVKTRFAYRFRLGYRLHRRHSLILLLAPLSVNAEGRLGKDVFFNEMTFPAGSDVTGLYRFNSWRLTYAYTLVNNDRWDIAIGFTAKIRDAEIRLNSGNLSSSKTDVGFVPLLYFRVQWSASPRFSIRLEGDALASPGGQGRAEDVFLGFLYHLSDRISLKAGYRIVEGGANVDAVYNFALIHYAAVGLILRF